MEYFSFILVVPKVNSFMIYWSNQSSNLPGIALKYTRIVLTPSDDGISYYIVKIRIYDFVRYKIRNILIWI